MLLRLPPGPTGALHERIAAAVRRAIADGEVVPGDRLPPAREVADGFGVNVNTVLRAYRDLRDEELIDLRRGRGATVRSRITRARLTQLVDELLGEAHRLGVTGDEVVGLLEERS